VPHCTPEQLALAALRERLPETDVAHLAACAYCRAEVASLQRGVDVLAVPELAAPGAAVPPPPGVWAGIAATTGVSAAPRPEVVAGSGHALTAVPAGPARPEVSARPEVPAPRSGRPASAGVVRPQWSRLLLAAAAALVVGVGIGAGAVALGTGDDEGVAVAAASLDPLDDSDATGEARVVERPDGSRVLAIDLSAADPDDGFYEVWLIDEAVQDMYSLGVVQGGGEVTLEVPPGVDLTEFPVVDVSVEPLDGNPGHSGVSIARGRLA
jgi:anti-sigma-K factor RskA